MEYNLINKVVLVTGGTGSFGRQILSRLLKEKVKEIRIFSRDEEKQTKLREEIKDNRVTYIIGDIRDYYRIREALEGVDIVFNAAALKQVPNCEFNPMEAVKTNILGAENVRRASIENKVEVVVSISTDKAVKPVNVMGMTKAIQERLMTSETSLNTKFVVVRYGNVIGSRGSIIPIFKEKLLKGYPLPITNFEMTRFLITLEEAVDLVFKAIRDSKGGEIFVKKLPSAKVVDIAKVMAKAYTGKENYPLEEIGIRPGEKIHEVLVSEEEMQRTLEDENHFIIFPYTSNIKNMHSQLFEYTSLNALRLSEIQIRDILDKTGWLK
ncbi:MAG: SDR family NAD(P)-dependent oxidoreductase [archaeon]